jgi:5-methyltetrahydrofolate--homocysteine methyltransferase
VAHLIPYIEEEKKQQEAAGEDVRAKGKIVIATVKGDVHDIGKNIVTVVLQCNNFEVVNMGVMVPCHEILAQAKVEGADIVGLSGLITPSLEEMQYVASEMQKDEHFRVKKIPLLIGGATCSRVHTAVKIAPHYEGPVVYVPDASRSVSVAQSLLSDQAAKYIAEVNADYDKVRQLHASKKQVPLWPLAKARANKTPVDWSNYTPPSRSSSAAACSRTTTWPSSRATSTGALLPDLGPGRRLPRHPEGRSGGRRSRARALRRPAHAQAPDRGPLAHRQRGDGLLARQHGQRRRHPALCRREPHAAGAHLVRPAPAGREAGDRRRDAPSRCLADFVAPKGVADDYVGAFAVTRGIGVGQEGAVLPGRPRRLLRDHAQGAGRPPGRGAGRGAARARAQGPVGLRADETLPNER